MNRNESYSANHRCEGSLKAHIRIMKDWKKGYFTSKGWWLIRVENDFEYDAIYLSKVCSISFCPFCGKQLEESV